MEVLGKAEQRLASRTNYYCPQEVCAKCYLEEQRKKQMGKTILITFVAFDSNKSCRQSSNGFCFSCIVAVQCTSVDSKRLSWSQTFWKPFFSQSAAKAAVYADKYCFSPLPVVIENAEPGFEPAVEQIRSLSLKLV